MVLKQNSEISREESRRCFICKGKGHLKLHCPMKKSGMTKPENVRTMAMPSMMVTSVFAVSAELI